VANYRCKWCGKVVKRHSDKAWIKSMCDATGYKTVHLMRVVTP
jgi:phage FluMu protein Com